MSEFLKAFTEQVVLHSERCAFFNTLHDSITYGELDHQSNALAQFVYNRSAQKKPLVLLGHKEPLMLVGMIAAMKAGSAFVPIDTSFAEGRVRNIVEQLDSPLILEIGEHSFTGSQNPTAVFISRTELDEIVRKDVSPLDLDVSVSGDDPLYILFTSGSTGTPKGVVQSAQVLDVEVEYFEKYLPAGDHLVCFNKTHFSFDMSHFDLAMGLTRGHTLFALDKSADESLSSTFQALSESHAATWVSTPSFLNMCLADPSFNERLIPELRSVIVAGESLLPSTVKKLFTRFSDIKLFNAYGPTETQAVTDIEVSPELLDEYDDIPIGYACPFDVIEIQDKETHMPKPEGEPGEIVVYGDTVALGYYARPDLTEKAFIEANIDGKKLRGYRTGDEGYRDKKGVIHYLGRFDLQVKINGYRVELEEVEATLESIESVSQACVVVIKRGGLVDTLVAYIIPEITQGEIPGQNLVLDQTDCIVEQRESAVLCDVEKLNQRAFTKAIKEALKLKLPAYMIPRIYRFVDAFPSNVNGKIDRKALAAQAAGGRNA